MPVNYLYSMEIVPGADFAVVLGTFEAAVLDAVSSSFLSCAGVRRLLRPLGRRRLATAVGLSSAPQDVISGKYPPLQKDSMRRF